jgi:hypothetical protein
MLCQKEITRKCAINNDRACTDSTTKGEEEVIMLCNKPSQQTKSMKTYALDYMQNLCNHSEYQLFLWGRGRGEIYNYIHPFSPQYF